MVDLMVVKMVVVVMQGLDELTGVKGEAAADMVDIAMV